MSVPPAPVQHEPALTLEAIIAQVQRDVRSDDHLGAIPDEPRDQTIAQAVQDRWATRGLRVPG